MLRSTGANAFAKNQTHLAYEDKRDLYCKMKNKAHVRRAFQPSQRDLEPYRKQHKITLFDYEIREIPRPLNTTQI